MGNLPAAISLRLASARLQLEPASVEHAPGLFAIMRDPALTTFLAWAPHEVLEETAALLSSLASAQAAEAGYHWTVLENGEVRGLISLIDVARRHRLWRLDRAEIAYWTDPKHQGRGLATEATEAVVNCAFGKLGLNRLRISHTSANPASGRIPQKLGFRFVGTEREFFQKNGVWHDMNHYELLASDWIHREERA